MTAVLRYKKSGIIHAVINIMRNIFKPLAHILVDSEKLDTSLTELIESDRDMPRLRSEVLQIKSNPAEHLGGSIGNIGSQRPDSENTDAIR